MDIVCDFFSSSHLESYFSHFSYYYTKIVNSSHQVFLLSFDWPYTFKLSSLVVLQSICVSDYSI